MERFDEAIHFAVRSHAGMFRKGGAPYIVHPLEVAAIAATMTVDEDVLCAAVLHDVVEDTDATLDDIREAFGDRVAELVRSETEDKHDELSREESWYMRKRDSIKELRANNDRAVHILWLSDKLSNMRSYMRMYEERGNQLWSVFHQSDPKLQAWYYHSVAQALDDLKDTLAMEEFVLLMSRIFEGVC